MKRTIIPHPLSWASVQSKASFSGTPLASFTGFTYRFEGKIYYVSNWHNFAGRHPDTKKCISDTGGIPDQLELVYRLDTDPIRWMWGKLNLFDAQGVAEWFEHPTFGSKVDVAVVEVVFSDEFEAAPVPYPVNEFQAADFALSAGQDVFVLGYPKETTGGGALPVWKHGTIASEPEADLDSLPKLLIDTASRQGMSGSPVFATEIQIIPVETESNEALGSLGRAYRFVGVYSGRVFSETPLVAYLLAGQKEKAEAALEANLFEAQLGIVWKASVIEEIIRGGKKPA